MTKSAPLTTETPRLDLLATESLRLTNFHVTASVCTPSRASLLTGRRQTRLNLERVMGQGSVSGVPEAELTMAEMLQTAGYYTAMVGKVNGL